MEHHNTKQQLIDLSKKSSKLVTSTFTIDDIVYVKDFKQGDGYDQHGETSEIWDLYVAVIEENKYKLYHYNEHFFWAHCETVPFRYSLERTLDFPLTFEGKTALSEFIKQIHQSHNNCDDYEEEDNYDNDEENEEAAE
jgi:hypothetical protein